MVPAGDAAGLSAILQGLSLMPAQLRDWRQHTGWVRQYSRESILSRFEQVLQTVVRGPVVTVPELKPAGALPA